MREILVSCVIPVYNAAEHLPALADMLAAQGREDFEAVFVDDGSTDGSGEILDAIVAAKRFPARALHQKNRGVSAARNAGMDAAQGEYIAFIDADDGIAPNYAQVMARCAGNGAEVTLLTHSRVVEGDFRFDVPGLESGPRSPAELLDAFLMNPTDFAVYDLLIRRDALQRTGVRFPEGYAYYEDYDFILRLFAVVKDIQAAGECVYCYRAAAGSAMSTFNDKRMECLQLFTPERSLYLKSMPDFRARFQKWFIARICWSAMWQACVSMGTKGALEFAGRWDMKRRMRDLADYPDRKVSLSARIYLLCPYIYIVTMVILGRRRTLIPKGAKE